MDSSRFRAAAAVAALVWVCGVGTVASAGEGAVGAVELSGYGEMHYNAPSDGVSELDFHRLVLGFATNLSDEIGFHAEVDFEHAFTEPELEFAYLDFFYREAVSFRTGLVLMPVGQLNESHEPPLFYSVERPYLEKYIIPTTWQEPGAGVVGSVSDGALAYRAYVVGGLDAAGFGPGGISGGRQHGAEASAEDFAAVARIEYSPRLATSVGVSGYVGGASQAESRLDDASVAIAEVDARLRVAALEGRASFAAVYVGGADSISAYTGDVVGERMLGYNAEIALHVLQALGTYDRGDLVAFARFEAFDTQDRVPDGLERDRSRDRRVVTLGASFLPAPNVALKADVELWDADDGSDRQQFNMGVGFMY